MDTGEILTVSGGYEAYQRRIANILESFTDGFFEVDLQWKVTYWNRQAEVLLGQPRSGILGRNLWEVYQDAVPLKFHTEYHRAVEENISVRFEEYFPAMDSWFEVAAFPSGEGLSVYFKDITLRIRSMEQLELERQKYRDLFNFSPVPQWVYDQQTFRFLDVNKAAISTYGFSREEFMRMGLADIRPEEEMARLVELLAERPASDVPHCSLARHRKKSGEIMEVCVQGTSIDFQGTSARLVTVIDRTGEIAAQRTIRESVARFDMVSRATSDVVCDWDMSTDEILWNRGITGIFGYDVQATDLKWRIDRIHPEDLFRVRLSIARAVRKREARLQLEYRFRHADGSYRAVLERALISFSLQGEAYRLIGSMQDISERISHIRKIEAQNERLKEISWIQSHRARAPLSNIMALVELIDYGILNDPENLGVIAKLKAEAVELDIVLKAIINHTISDKRDS